MRRFSEPDRRVAIRANALAPRQAREKEPDLLLKNIMNLDMNDVIFTADHTQAHHPPDNVYEFRFPNSESRSCKC